ncbi:hypothetical protein ACWD5Z_30425 [Micromonospora chokoriensis]
MIVGLADLGRALGYSVEEERPIGESGAAVDLAWYAAGDAAVPLVIFEVESSASASMANNAMKVLARDAEDFVKPLFFFHVLLSGGPDNDRICGLRRQWGSHNYRVYRLNEDAELLRLVCDVLAQHRRIRIDIDVAGLSQALLLPPWNRLCRPTVLRRVERLGFHADFLGSYARAAADELDIRPEYLRRLRVTHDVGARLAGEGYGTYLGDIFPNMLDVAVLVAADLIPESQAVSAFEAWQTRSGDMRTVGPYFGLSRDYDQYVIGISPFIYGVAGLLLLNKPAAYLWLVNDMRTILSDARKRWSFDGLLAIPTALWLSHLAAAGLSNSTISSKADARESLHSAYKLAVKIIENNGYLPASVIDNPPPYVDIWETSDWEERLAQPGIGFPPADALNARYMGQKPDGLWEDPIGVALAIACYEEWPRWMTKGLVVALRAELAGEADVGLQRP